MRRLTCALVLLGSTGALQGLPRDAYAAPKQAASSLQLGIITPDPSAISDRMSLDVTFHGGAVATVELYLDKALVAKRQLNTVQTRGVITFALDTVQLAEGAHEVVVRAYGPDGKSTDSTARIRIPAADLSAPVRIAYPQNGLQVNGVIPIRVTLDPSLQKLKPYVTFFVDKDLKVLRNYPPYEYNWDTTKVPNGWHIVEAWSQAEDSNTPLKARPIHVNVNNASGETRRLNSIPDLRQESAPAKPLTLAFGATTTGGTTPDVVSGRSSVPASATRPRAGDSAPRAAEPSGFGYGAVSHPGTRSTLVPGRTARIAAVAPKMVGGAIKEPGDRMAIASAPRGLLPSLGNPTEMFPVVSPARAGAGADTGQVKPGETLESISRKTGVRANDIARLNNLPAESRSLTARALIVPRSGAFDVAFDGNLIAFDVRPRIENGLRLAPFRQIFEHTGGRLYWFGGTAQTVRAVNETREIELKIGDPMALVNNQQLRLDRKPFIDSGRTIVPLTFVRDALNVRIDFDASSGRLLIQSK